MSRADLDGSVECRPPPPSRTNRDAAASASAGGASTWGAYSRISSPHRQEPSRASDPRRRSTAQGEDAAASSAAVEDLLCDWRVSPDRGGRSLPLRGKQAFSSRKFSRLKRRIPRGGAGFGCGGLVWLWLLVEFDVEKRRRRRRSARRVARSGLCRGATRPALGDRRRPRSAIETHPTWVAAPTRRPRATDPQKYSTLAWAGSRLERSLGRAGRRWHNPRSRPRAHVR